MKFYVLTENRARKRGFLAEHGLSVFIEYKGMNILFDTGQTSVYLHNAKMLGIDLEKSDCIVLSHGHYDHCGGLEFFPKAQKLPKIYIKEEAFEEKFALNSDKKSYREIGIPWKREDFCESICFSKQKTQIANGVYLCSEIPYTVEFEKPSGGLFVKKGGELLPDEMPDEQMLVFETEKGLVIFLGCSHPGIVNCLSCALELFPGEKIHTLFAGMHLDGVSGGRLEKTIDFFKKCGIEQIIPVHCTGVEQACEIKRAFREKCSLMGAGDFFEIGV